MQIKSGDTHYFSLMMTNKKKAFNERLTAKCTLMYEYVAHEIEVIFSI